MLRDRRRPFLLLARQVSPWSSRRWTPGCDWTERLAACLSDRRQPGKVQHAVCDLLRQRVFGLALGYADCSDAARLADDPIQKLLLDRVPLSGSALGSQPTLSRFENTGRRGDLYALAETVADTVLAVHRRRLGRRARRITLDLDTTEDPTHGQQEFAFFNGYYGHWCYLPLVATATFNAERQQYLVAALLQLGEPEPNYRRLCGAEPGLLTASASRPRLIPPMIEAGQLGYAARFYCAPGQSSTAAGSSRGT